MKGQAWIPVIIVVLGIAILSKVGLQQETIYQDITKVPCTYAGCENTVSCPSDTTKNTCQGIGTSGGFCECLKYTKVSCILADTVIPSNLLALPSKCGTTQKMVWYCDQAFQPGNYIWQYRCEDKPLPSCGWCGSNCVERVSGQVCTMVMPPEGYECKIVGSTCQKVQVGQPPIGPPATPPAENLTFEFLPFEGETSQSWILGIVIVLVIVGVIFLMKR